MTQVCLMGLGRTGMEIARILLEQRDIKLVGAICSDFTSKAGKDIGEILNIPDTGAKVYTSNQLKTVIEKLKPDVFVDFSNHKATMKHVKLISEHHAGLVIGTTGFSRTDLMRLMVLSKKNQSGILYAPNITLGVNVMMLLSNIAARILNDYDFEITEAHHKYKKDSPSGTALKIADEIEKGLEATGVEVNEGIPIHAIRAGGIVGRHQLMIAGENDKLEIVHESFSRKAFAAGALRGIHFIRDKKGFYEMRDVLDLEKVLASYFEKRRIALYRQR
ncbi:MAG: 4-hydroxy-tetrahydrodipicolinate reductase [Clostridia bacterium]|nr:4-hydroxy-tetrahydrodipicolinate reductase [Clostridia bacterium]